MLESIDQYFKGHDHLNDTTKTPNSQGSSFLSSKFLSNGPISGNKNLQRQSVVTTLLDKPQFIKILHSKLFHRTSLEEFMKKTDKDQSEHKVSREEFKQNKGEHKSFIQGQKCHIYKKIASNWFYWKRSKPFIE